VAATRGSSNAIFSELLGRLADEADTHNSKHLNKLPLLQIPQTHPNNGSGNEYSDEKPSKHAELQAKNGIWCCVDYVHAFRKES
jgi:hypothetical protein